MVSNTAANFRQDTVTLDVILQPVDGLRLMDRECGRDMSDSARSAARLGVNRAAWQASIAVVLVRARFTSQDEQGEMIRNDEADGYLT
jgi:hypothetical protein